MSERIYLDNAATSWPKPESVYRAVDHYLRHNGSTLGRTTSSLSSETQSRVDRLRHQIRTLAAASTAECLFTFNGTDSLNLAIQGTLGPGDHVVTTVAEHNSVLRPLRMLEERTGIEVTRLACDSCGRVSPDDIKKNLKANTKLVAVIHCSNVTGGLNDLEAIGAVARSTEALFLVDAAQSFGSQEIGFDRCGIDLLASPGHKGLMGPLGTGILLVSERAQSRLQPVRQGGTGASSDSDQHPTSFPEGFESGNANVPGLIGLQAGVEYVSEQGVAKIAKKKMELASVFTEGISRAQGIRLAESPGTRESGIVSFNLQVAPAEVAMVLDTSFGIQVRAGYHCASLIHPYTETPQGCVRVSFGCWNEVAEAESAAQALCEIADSLGQF
ncbi:MAG: aminotransferase class V-fold PLP-dependent enzyme [Planctomycetota bacterium]|nr:aminotransferase class V-fold PLP-dependent enzyme [Planctomycetota bacterium]